MAGKSIILTADDYGAMDFIDKAIVECVRNGSINCVSCFVCFPTSQQRLLELKAIQREEAAKGNHFGIGLHFSVTAGNPCLQKENSLSERVNGVLQFKNARHYPFPRVLHTELQDELEEQIRLLSQWLGGVDRIDHISNHHGVVYVDDEFFSVYSEVAVRYRLPIRSPKLWSRTRLDFDKERFRVFNPLTRYGIYQLQWMQEYFEARHDDLKVQEAAQKQLAFPYCNNDCIYGLGHPNNLHEMLGNYARYDMTTEFMFHLGYFRHSRDEEPDEQTPNGIDPGYFNDRKKELDLLRNYQLDVKLGQAGVSKILFRQLNYGAHLRLP